MPRKLLALQGFGDCLPGSYTAGHLSVWGGSVTLSSGSWEFPLNVPREQRAVLGCAKLRHSVPMIAADRLKAAVLASEHRSVKTPN